MTKKLNALMLIIIAVGPVHIGEQLITSIEEFHLIRDALGGWYGLFPEAYVDHASVVLITIVFTVISLVFYALMRGGVAPLMVAGLFGVLGINEAHHWIEAISERAYDPGLFTSFAYVGAGLLIMVEVFRELKMRWSWTEPTATNALGRSTRQQV
jgi:hypothetical protein